MNENEKQVTSQKSEGMVKPKPNEKEDKKGSPNKTPEKPKIETKPNKSQ